MSSDLWHKLPRDGHSTHTTVDLQNEVGSLLNTLFQGLLKQIPGLKDAPQLERAATAAADSAMSLKALQAKVQNPSHSLKIDLEEQVVSAVRARM